MPRHVFISHASDDRAVADDWRQALEAEGLVCWIAPRDILPSADWAEQIIDGIDAAWAMLLILGAAANRSPQVRREVERAVHKRLPVLPLRIDDVALSKSLEYFLSAQHWVDVDRGPPAGHLHGVVRALRALRPEAPGRPGGADGADAATAAPRVPVVTVGPVGPVELVVPVVPVSWDPALLARIEQRLSLLVGPVASVLVQRASRRARSEGELVELLARDVDDPQARQRFVAAGRGG